MHITEFLSPSSVLSRIKAGSKKRVLETVSETLAGATPNFTADEIFSSLITRERLGSTGLGQGVAIPHGRMEDLEQPLAAFMSLAEPVDFEAPDGQPVDLIFALLVPAEATQEHLTLLAQLAGMFSDQEFCGLLRATSDSSELYKHLLNWKHRESA